MMFLWLLWLPVLLYTGHVQGLHKFKVGVIMVEKSVLPFKMEMVGAALDIAMEKAEHDFGIKFLPIIKLYPDFCNSVLTSGAVSDLYHVHNVSALIGPGCSGDIMVCGKLATFYKLPLVSGVGDLVLDKVTYPTFTRLSYSLEKQSVFFKATMEHFSWRHLVIIYDTYDVLMRIQGGALKKALVADPAYPRPYDITYDTTKQPNYYSMLSEARQHARVILFLTSGGDLRKFMLTASDMGLTSEGEFAFLTIELFQSEAWGDFSWHRGDAHDREAKRAYESLLFITLTIPAGPQWDQFTQDVIYRSQRDYNFTYEEAVNYFVGAFHDSVIYLAMALNRTIEDGQSPYNGVTVAQKMWNNTFTGIMGDVYIDEIGDRIADYSLLDMTNLEEGTYEIVAKYYGSGHIFMPEESKSIHWPGTGLPPPDIPKCGFKGEAPECSNQMVIAILGSVLLVVAIFGSLLGSTIYRRFRFESELSSTAWQIKWEEVSFNRAMSIGGSTSRLSLQPSTQRSKEDEEEVKGQIYTTVGMYKGTLIAIRKIQTTKFEINRPVLLELKMMREVHHDNLTRFAGASIGNNFVAVCSEYCPKGSLEDILANDAIKLDWTFRYSLISDVVRGMIYLHDVSPLSVHGRLKSSNCVVDGRFVLKITDYGLPSFYYAKNRQSVAGEEVNLHTYYRRLFWRAPELLDVEGPGDAEGDVYSFGIILQEIITRTEPYDLYDLSPQELIERVKNRETPPFRPQVDRSMCAPKLYKLMEMCWSDCPTERPSFITIRHLLKECSKDIGRGNILDNLLLRMENYAENLESLVENRTQALQDEKKRSETLLYQVLPKSIAEQLKRGQPVEPEAYTCVSIYFSDIVGFTALSAKLAPLQVVDLLNQLYTVFDAIINEFDVYKVETIGDAYMVVSGLPVANGNEHARQIALMSLKILDASLNFTIRQSDEKLRLRIGVHSGSVVAGVVGLTMPRYCLFGDTVNTASRMESTSEACRIQISGDTMNILDKFAQFDVQYRGETAVKGKGTMQTYWLLGSL